MTTTTPHRYHLCQRLENLAIEIVSYVLGTERPNTQSFSPSNMWEDLAMGTKQIRDVLNPWLASYELSINISAHQVMSISLRG